MRSFTTLIIATSLVGCAVEPEPESSEPIIVEFDDEEPVVDDQMDVEDDEVVEPMLKPHPSFVGVPVLDDINDDPNIVEVELAAQSKPVTLTDGLEVDMYTYNGSTPGPLLEATVGDRVIVHFTNRLDEPTTIHWHGLRIPDEMDGNPRIQDPVQPGETFTYEFVVPDEGTFWYHPHVRTNAQIELGLYGPMVVHEKAEERPRHDRERFFLLDDILLDGDRVAAPFSGGHMELMHGRFGNALLTNGTLDGVTGEATQGQRERWRFVNTSNARTMKIGIEGARFKVYGTDGGRVEPYETTRLQLPVGQRFDVEVAYEEEGMVRLQQHVRVRNQSGQVVTEAYDVAQIEVAAAPGESEPTTVEWVAAPPLPDREIDREETIVLDAVEGGEMGVQWRINGEAHNMEPLYEFENGETVKMLIRNMLGPEHPFHLHGQFFSIPDTPGMWDTILVPGQSTVEITAYMDNPGEWMMHCHIAEHAELGMMSSFVVNE